MNGETHILESPDADPRYSQFWSDNLEKIEQLHRELQQSLLSLEKEYIRFEPSYARIEELLGVLSSLYADHRVLPGTGYLQTIQRFMQLYRGRYTRHGFDFNEIDGLLAKLKDALRENFEHFPHLARADAQTGAGAWREARLRDLDASPCKWITFNRNGSWFLAAFRQVRLVDRAHFSIAGDAGKDSLLLLVDGEKINARDLFASQNRMHEEPAFLVMIDGGARSYIASGLGKRIYAGKDLVGPRLRPYRSVRHSSLSPGRVRLFGKNHIILY